VVWCGVVWCVSLCVSLCVSVCLCVRAQQVIDYYENLAHRGDHTGIFGLLGQMHFYGAKGLPQDFDAAAKMFQIAADNVSVKWLGACLFAPGVVCLSSPVYLPCFPAALTSSYLPSSHTHTHSDTLRHTHTHSLSLSLSLSDTLRHSHTQRRGDTPLFCLCHTPFSVTTVVVHDV
jgi:TPR repeat protein